MSETTLTDAEIVNWIIACRDEADEAKRDRMDTNRNNYDTFHLKYDFSHKEEGQSQEILAKQAMAVESNKAFFQQALADLKEWWKADAAYPEADATLPIRPHEITKVTSYMLDKANYFSHVGNCIESAMLASLAISKISGCMKNKPKFVPRKSGRGKGLKRWVEKVENKSWQAEFDCVRAENFYPDPSGKGLYEIEDSYPDFFEVKYMAEEDEDFDMDEIENLSPAGVEDAEEATGRSRETGQNTTSAGHRRKVKLTEYWGTILHPTSGEIVFENIQAIVANDTTLILRPRPNPLWHQRSPYTVSPLMEVANSVWHKAPMDAPTQYNNSMIEMYNLLVDAGMKQVHAVSQLRKDWLDNPAQVSEGIEPGMALVVNALCPPGGKVMESLTAVQIPSEAFNIFSIMMNEFNSSAMTNEIRQGAAGAGGDTSATAIVEASQSITSVFQGMAKNYEGRQSQKELELAWMTIAQNWDLIDKEVFVSLFGQERGNELALIPSQEIFANTVNGVRFKVFGISLTLAKAQDFRKITTLLQTIAASPQLMEEFMKKYDLGKTLGEIMTSLNIDKEKLEIPLAVQKTMEAPQEEAPPAGPDQMSQVPGAATGNDSMQSQMSSMLPQGDFAPTPMGGGAM